MKYAVIVMKKDRKSGGTFYFNDFHMAKMMFDEYSFYGWNEIEYMYLTDAIKNRKICKFEGFKED